MYLNAQTRRYFSGRRLISIIGAHVVVLAILAGALLSSGTDLLGAFAQSPCSSGDQMYKVAGGDTLGAIASRYNTSWQSLSSYNKLANPNVLYINQHICIPGKATTSGKPMTSNVTLNAKSGAGNFFPYAQCTWFANQRYHELSGRYVPWTTNANAWQWVTRAYQYGWKVSSSPSVGSIIVLQPWTQGAYGLGHVGVVEQVRGNGSIVASNMNWGGNGAAVVNTTFHAGPGVSFVSV
jgi:N-acetylmuramoyl-L-alanine amidase